jgi:hypothetical protein
VQNKIYGLVHKSLCLVSFNCFQSTVAQKYITKPNTSGSLQNVKNNIKNTLCKSHQRSKIVFFSRRAVKCTQFTKGVYELFEK